MRGAGYLLVPRDAGKVVNYEENRKKYLASCPNQESEELRRQLMDLQQRVSDAEQRASDLEQKVSDANQKAKYADQRAADAEHRTAEKLALQEEQFRAEFEGRLLQSKHDLQAVHQRKFLEIQGELKEAKDTVAIQAETIENFQAEKPVEKQSERQEQERLRMHLEDYLATQCELRSKLSETKHSLTVQRNAFDLKVEELNSTIGQLVYRYVSKRNRTDVAQEFNLEKKCNWDHESHYTSSEIQVVYKDVQGKRRCEKNPYEPGFQLNFETCECRTFDSLMHISLCCLYTHVHPEVPRLCGIRIVILAVRQ